MMAGVQDAKRDCDKHPHSLAKTAFASFVFVVSGTPDGCYRWGFHLKLLGDKVSRQENTLRKLETDENVQLYEGRKKTITMLVPVLLLHDLARERVFGNYTGIMISSEKGS